MLIISLIIFAIITLIVAAVLGLLGLVARQPASSGDLKKDRRLLAVGLF